MFSDKMLGMFDFFHTLLSQLNNVFETGLELWSENLLLTLKTIIHDWNAYYTVLVLCFQNKILSPFLSV